MKSENEKKYDDNNFVIMSFLVFLFNRKLILLFFILIFGVLGYLYSINKTKVYDLSLKASLASSSTETKFKILSDQLQEEWTNVYGNSSEFNNFNKRVFFHNKYSLLESFVNEITDHDEFISSIAKFDKNFQNIKDEEKKNKYILGLMSNFKIHKSEGQIVFNGGDQIREVIHINFDFKTNDIKIGKLILKNTIEDSFLNFKKNLVYDYNLIIDKIKNRKLKIISNLNSQLILLEEVINRNNEKSIRYLEFLKKLNKSERQKELNYKIKLTEIDKTIKSIKSDIKVNNFESYFIAKSLLRSMKFNLNSTSDYINISDSKPVIFNSQLIKVKGEDTNDTYKDIFVIALLGLVLGIIYIILENQIILFRKFKRENKII